ncbi:10693_t:CDS:2, partial [Gigaspora margarita]
MATMTHVLLGILEHNGTVINKIGTVSLALAAQHHGKPVYLVLRTDKILGEYDDVKIEENDSNNLCYVTENQFLIDLEEEIFSFSLSCEVSNLRSSVTTTKPYSTSEEELGDEDF